MRVAEMSVPPPGNWYYSLKKECFDSRLNDIFIYVNIR